MTSDSGTADILLIDDDRQLGAMLGDFLRTDKLSLTICNNGEDGLALLQDRPFDLLILDIMLPGISGLEVLRRLRQDNELPVIMLTARGDDVDRIVGLEIGADDYLPKPFNPRELSARIKAILRRAQVSVSNQANRQFNGIQIDPRTRRAAVNGRPLRLTGTEFEILRCLLETPGNVVGKEQLSERALGRRLLPYDRSIDTHISNLRGKLELAGNDSATIQNQRGIGYVLVPNE
jgi:two-component system, OmpR family, response regulator CpxR